MKPHWATKLVLKIFIFIFIGYSTICIDCLFLQYKIPIELHVVTVNLMVITCIIAFFYREN